MPREALLARTMVRLADSLVDDYDLVDLLSTLTEGCVDVLDVTAAGLMLVAPDGDLRVMASSSDTMRVLELFELQSREGPCLDCYHSASSVTCADLSVETRWPRFTAEALKAGFTSVFAVPMRLRGRVLGAVNLFSANQVEIRESDLVAAGALADVATIAILQQRAVQEAQLVNEQLDYALTSRIAIEQAKGVIAERAGVGVEDAFARLRRHARSNNLRLAEVARGVVDGSVATEVFA